MTPWAFQTQRTSSPIAGLIVVALASTVLAQHEVYLETPNTVPSYCQENEIWCGAGTAQMILEGYPGGAEHPFPQTHIWSRIHWSRYHRQTGSRTPHGVWANDATGRGML
jgi:hypothetical protein